jgi:hypothetical protein
MGASVCLITMYIPQNGNFDEKEWIKGYPIFQHTNMRIIMIYHELP